jgi:hypothetical protein
MISQRLPAVFGCAVLLGVTACRGFFDLTGRDVTVSVRLQRSWDPPPVLRVIVGGRRVEIEARLDGRRVDEEIQAPGSGDLPVVVQLIGADGNAFAETQFAQRFERGNSHWVAVDVGPERPLGICIGIVLAIPTPFEGDTTFVMYGKIPVGAIC